MIPIYLIETFVLFGENTNLVRTAKALNQTQPTTSRQIELLQSYFKKPLFKSVGRTKRLTEYGEQVQQYYKNSILELRELQNKMGSTSFANEKEKLVLAARSEILEKYIVDFNFKNTVEMQALSGQEIRLRMQAQTLDIAVLQESFESFDYFRKKLFSSEWKIIFPESWRNKLTTKPSQIESWVRQASPLPFASYDKDLQTLKMHFIKKSQMPEFNIELIAPDWRLIQKSVQKQRCWSIVPEDFSKAEKVVALPANDLLISSNFYIYFLKTLQKNKDLAQMVDELKS